MNGKNDGQNDGQNEKTPRRRGWIYRSIVILLITLVSLAVLEGAVRLFGIAPVLPKEYSGFISDPYLPFRKKPNLVRRGMSRSGEFEFEYRHNSMGFRDVEHDILKPPGVYRILTLGDSLTFGVGADYENTYPTRLEVLLNERPNTATRVEIIKAGVPRYFPEIERLMLEYYGLQYAPDLVIVGFNPNDVADTFVGIEGLRPSSKEGYLISKEGQRLGDLGVWLYRHSHAARIVLRKVLDASAPEKGKRRRWKDMTREDYRKSCGEALDEVLRMRDIAEENGAKLLLVYLPQSALDLGALQFFDQVAKERGLEYVELLTVLARARARGELVFWPKDGHCTPQGYGVIANRLFDVLTEKGLVP